jgi:hypothetical protein
VTDPIPSVFRGIDLPASALNRVKNRPIEDVALAILRRGLPDVPSYALIPKDTPSYFLIVRGLPELGDYNGRRGLLHQVDFAVHAYAQDPEGDEKAALLGDAVVDVMEQAFLEHWALPGFGTVNKIKCFQYPSREPDWATSTGPVQYADLPTGDWRYEARFRARINTPRVLAD